MFIVQLDGRKRWRIYGDEKHLPLAVVANEQKPSPASLGPPLFDVEVEAGDLIYLPRGHVHEAATGPSRSAHLTVGVYCFRWLDLLHEALRSVAQHDARLREALPRGFFLEPKNAATMGDHFRDILAAAAETAGLAEARDRLLEFFITKLPPLGDGHLEQIDRLDDLGVETVVRKRRGTLCRVFLEGDNAYIQFPGSQVSAPRGLEPVLRFIARSEEFRVGDLPDPSEQPEWLAEQVLADPGFRPIRMTPASKLVLVKQMIQNGLLRMVLPGEPLPVPGRGD